jgi:hypothetical protein
MKARITLTDEDLKEACSLLAAKRGLAIAGSISISHTPSGADRPWDPASTSISFEVEMPELSFSQLKKLGYEPDEK